jgi:hypothetical protein
MLKRVLSLGFAILLGNWIQVAAVLSHGCQAAAPVGTAEAAAESTPATAPAYPVKDDHPCCPHPRQEPVVSNVDAKEEMSCRGNSADCCELERPAFVSTPESTAAWSEISLVSMYKQSAPPADAPFAAASDQILDRVSPLQNMSLRL